ncbi:MAG: hypothetical protein JST54_08870 [Deltaproteobacteria bacterium]|nr:hypothetical protein [Deltaproteobacteria bacterium]
MSSAAIPGAVCPRHPSEAIAFTCTRCGGFRCELCRGEGNVCSDCAARALDPENLAFMPAVRDGVRLALKQAPVLAGVILLDCLIHFGFAWLEHALLPEVKPLRPGAGSLAVFARGMVLRTALLMLISVLEAFPGAAIDGIQFVNLYDATRGQARPLGAQVPAALQRYPGMLAVNLLTNVGMALMMTLCCAPAVLFGAVVAFVEPEVVLGGQGPIEALRRSFRRALPMFWKLVAMVAAYFAAEMVLMVGLKPVAHLFGAPGEWMAEGVDRCFAVTVSFVLNAIVTVLYVRTRLVEKPK